MANRMPQTISDKVLARCAQDETVVVVPRDGKPARVFSLASYLKIKEQPGKHQPWKGRGAKCATPDPLGTAHWELGVQGPLTRTVMYEMGGEEG